MIRRPMVLFALIGLGLAAAPQQSYAQAWPSKPVKFIAPFAAGGTSDTLGRIAAEHLRDKLHQQFYVENRVGAGGMIGSREVAAAEPDGYTFVVSGIASHVIAPAFSRHPPYDGLRDFTHVAYLGGPPVVLVVHPSLGVRSFRNSSISPGAPRRASTTCRQGSEPTAFCSPRTWRGASISSSRMFPTRAPIRPCSISSPAT
jgi:tripartite-type tricarboxylate transporter receptor subunit TctC